MVTSNVARNSSAAMKQLSTSSQDLTMMEKNMELVVARLKV